VGITFSLKKGSVNASPFQSRLSLSCVALTTAPLSQTRWVTLKTFFLEYSARKKVRLELDIVEYSLGDQAPMYDLNLGKQTMQGLGVKLDFKEKTTQIDKILLPMRNIINLQLKPSITRALRQSTCFTQEPISTSSATKCVVAIFGQYV
jgi:hypothetical protein